jgi:5,5'-dehydrodivanillate O-demethylase
MLTVEENEVLTRVGAGTPGGELLRRYWHPIAGASELDKNATKRVRILCEDLVLYRDRSGTLGLIEPFCAHRRMDLFYGIPEVDGLRCAYHGWMYNETGACVE